MIVLHCAETIKGGIASYLTELLPLQSNDISISKVITLIPDDQMSELRVEANVLVETFKRSNSRVLNSWRLAIKALHLVKQYNVSITHLHSTFAGLIARPLLFTFNRNLLIIYCAHGWAWDRTSSRLSVYFSTLIELALSTFTDKIICISHHEKHSAELRKISNKKLILIRNGIGETPPPPAGIYPDWRNASKKILFLGRFDYQKGLDILLCAMRQIGSDAHAIIAGGEVLGNSVFKSVPQNVSLVGWINGSQREVLFQSADVLVVPSRWEGFGLVAIEAMRAGLPVIATNVGGLAEIVQEGVTGFLIEPESPGALVDSIRNFFLLDRHNLRANAKNQFLATYTVARVHKELLQAYRG